MTSARRHLLLDKPVENKTWIFSIDPPQTPGLALAQGSGVGAQNRHHELRRPGL